VYADWRDSWYTAPHHIKVQQVESIAGGRVRARASADIAGQQWEVADVYSVEQGMVRIDRSFAHPGSGSQSKITLESRLRLPLGTDQRMLMPGVLYNNNPATSITSGTKLSTSPGGLGLYEEHRLPVPMVNVESLVKGCRNYGSLVATPSKIPQGHKGDDHWWSMGLEYGQGYVDLLSVSGPVATNGMKSQVYGHLGGFDPYDDAYLDVQGPVVFKKTLYLDLGAGIKSGYAFRETLWKSYNVFRPVQTPHVPFAEAMSLITGHARTRYIKPAGNTVIAEPAGYGILPGHGGFTYGWIGGNLGIAYGCLNDAHRTGDETARKEAVSAIQYFVRNSRASVEGLYYGDCNSTTREWSGLSSRQYGENLGHLASLIELGWKNEIA
jgi:hypothetical protein